MTKYEILLCIYSYLDKAWCEDQNKSEEYLYYISNLNPNIWQGEGTADPAYYQEFLKICNSFFKKSECTLEEGFHYAKKYLDKYNIQEHNEFSSNIDEVIAVFSKCTISEWHKIYAELKNR